MRRDQALIPLSHQHHNALALCVRIERSYSPQAGQQWAAGDAFKWQEQITSLFQDEIQYHFQAEEQVLFPAAMALPALASLVEELTQEHLRLRDFAARAATRELADPDLLEFSRLLSAHVRKEERELFEIMQSALPPDTLQRLGKELDAWFGSSGMPGAVCRV